MRDEITFVAAGAQPLATASTKKRRRVVAPLEHTRKRLGVGEALLRKVGGWEPGVPIGARENGALVPIVPQPRPAGLGLGAPLRPAPVDAKKNKPAKSERPVPASLECPACGELHKGPRDLKAHMKSQHGRKRERDQDGSGDERGTRDDPAEQPTSSKAPVMARRSVGGAAVNKPFKPPTRKQ